VKEVTVKIQYPGSVISCNHFKYKGGIYTKPGAKDFMAELGWMLKQYHIEDWKLPLSVTCSGRFRDKRSTPDLSNLAKICLDSIEEACDVNDRHMRWHDGDITYGEPTLWITIKEQSND